jgi:hypothetical protein
MTVIAMIRAIMGIKQQNLTLVFLDSISQVYPPFGRLED